jgi:hypothetical protein
MIKAGAALTGGGMMIATMGMAITAIAMIRGAMAWSRQRGISPAGVAAARMGQARHATMAGMHAWHEHAGAGANGQRG